MIQIITLQITTNKNISANEYEWKEILKQYGVTDVIVHENTIIRGTNPPYAFDGDN